MQTRRPLLVTVIASLMLAVGGLGLWGVVHGLWTMRIEKLPSTAPSTHSYVWYMDVKLFHLYGLWMMVTGIRLLNMSERGRLHAIPMLRVGKIFPILSFLALLVSFAGGAIATSGTNLSEQVRTPWGLATMVLQAVGIWTTLYLLRRPDVCANFQNSKPGTGDL